MIIFLSAELETFFSVNEHLALFLLSCLFGAGFGVLFDVFRVLRILLPHNNILTAIEDFLFFCIYGIFIMLFTLVFARGDFRIFYAFGNILGFLVYFFTVGTVVVGVFIRFSNAIRAVIRFLTNKIFAPVIKTISRICKKVFNFL